MQKIMQIIIRDDSVLVVGEKPLRLKTADLTTLAAFIAEVTALLPKPLKKDMEAEKAQVEKQLVQAEKVIADLTKKKADMVFLMLEQEKE